MAHPPADTTHSHGAHGFEHGTMDISRQENTYGGFLRGAAIVAGVTAVILIFLAFVGT